MCGIVMLVCMLIFGLIALVRGRFLLTRATEVRGVPARIIGVVLILPFPLTFAAGIVWGAILLAQGKTAQVSDAQGAAWFLQFGIVAICILTVVVIALATGKPIPKHPTKEALADIELASGARDRFRPEQEERPLASSENQDITDRPTRPKNRPDDRIQE